MHHFSFHSLRHISLNSFRLASIYSTKFNLSILHQIKYSQYTPVTTLDNSRISFSIDNQLRLTKSFRLPVASIDSQHIPWKVKAHKICCSSICPTKHLQSKANGLTRIKQEHHQASPSFWNFAVLLQNESQTHI